MNKTQKQKQICFLKDIFSNIESIVLTSIEGLNTDQIVNIRKKLYENKIFFKIIKNKLAKIAIIDNEISILKNDFVGATAIAWSKKDAVGPARILVDFKNDIEKLIIKAGYNAGKRFDFEELKILAKLPNINIIKANILGLIEAVLIKIILQVKAPANHIVNVLQAKINNEKK